MLLSKSSTAYYVYDTAANLIDDGLLTYRYDLFGHLAQVDRKITGGTEPSPTAHAAGIDRGFVLHVRETAEVRPIYIFDPAVHDGLVGFVEGVFEVLQADDQANRLGRGALVFALAVGECRVEPGPVDLVSQLHQRVIAIEDLIEMGLEKFKIVAGSRLGLYGIRSSIAGV